MGFGGGIGRWRSALAFLAVLTLVAAVLVSATPARPAAALDAEEEAFLALINSYRADNGLGPLSLNSQLDSDAVWMSQDMAAHNYFSHSDSLGRDPFQRMADFGYTYNTWRGENLAAGVQAAQAAFDLFKGSPGHNANMLNSNFKVIGIARAYGSGTTYGWYWATEFGGQGEPPPAAPTPEPPAPPPPQPASTPAPPQPTPATFASPSVQDATPRPTAAPAPTPEVTPKPATAPTSAAPVPPRWGDIASLVRPLWDRLMVLDNAGSMLSAVSHIAERYLELTTGAFVQGEIPRSDIMLGFPVPGQL